MIKYQVNRTKLLYKPLNEITVIHDTSLLKRYYTRSDHFLSPPGPDDVLDKYEDMTPEPRVSSPLSVTASTLATPSPAPSRTVAANASSTPELPVTHPPMDRSVNVPVPPSNVSENIRSKSIAASEPVAQEVKVVSPSSASDSHVKVNTVPQVTFSPVLEEPAPRKKEVLMPNARVSEVLEDATSIVTPLNPTATPYSGRMTRSRTAGSLSK